MSKDLSFLIRFLKTGKSSRSNAFGVPSKKPKRGVMVWNSRKNGTFVKEIYGELIDLKIE